MLRVYLGDVQKLLGPHVNGLAPHMCVGWRNMVFLPYLIWAISPTTISATGSWMSWPLRIMQNFCSSSMRLCSPRNCFSLLQSLKAVTNTTMITEVRMAAPSIQPVSASSSSSGLPEAWPHTIQEWEKELLNLYKMEGQGKRAIENNTLKRRAALQGNQRVAEWTPIPSSLDLFVFITKRHKICQCKACEVQLGLTAISHNAKHYGQDTLRCRGKDTGWVAFWVRMW